MDKLKEAVASSYRTTLLWKQVLRAAEACPSPITFFDSTIHMAPAVAALKAGKHVICEKPLAMNANECRKMVKAAKDSRKLLVIGFQQRFSPNSQAIKRAIDEGILALRPFPGF